MSKPVSGYLSLPAEPFLVDVLQFEYPAIYTGILNISFVHPFSSNAQSETPSLRAFPREKTAVITNTTQLSN